MILAAALGAAMVTAAACDPGSGELTNGGGKNGNNGADGDGSDRPVNPEATQPLPEGTTIGKAGLRRLTRREYENTIRDVFALGAEWTGSALTADRASELGFDNDVTMLEIDDTRSGELVTSAESVADVILKANKLATVAGCQTLGKECVGGIVDSVASRLYRRALTGAEKERYTSLFDSVAGQATAQDGVKWVLVALLDSPNFLYRSELGVTASASRIALTGEEIATELAYTFRGTLPDADLLEKGRKGELDSAENRVKEARALLDTPRGHEVLADFMQQWLKYSDVKSLVKDAAVVPNFNAVRDDMAEETRHFLDYVLYEKHGNLRDLFTTTQTFVTPALATHYGITGSGMVERPAEQGIGILAQGSLLSRYGLTGSSSPPQRGAFVRRKLLCQSLPKPPPNAGEPPIPQPGLTTRELYETVHTSKGGCKGCHATIDPIGFGLEHFDVAGRYRTTEKNKPIDASGTITNFGSAPDATFTDHKGLAKALAESADVADCVGGMMAAYAFGTGDARNYTVPDARTAMRSGSVDILGYFAQLAAAPHFAARSSQ
jgi:hypothetical protein